MSLRLIPPVFQFANSAGQPYAGGSLTFYRSGASQLENTYTTEALSVASSNPVTLNSAGWPATDIFLSPGAKYRHGNCDWSGA